MTAEQWLTCTEPSSMLAFASLHLSERRRRLFACACCRRAWSELHDSRSRRAVIVAEQYAEGELTEEELGMASAGAAAVWDAETSALDPAGTADLPPYGATAAAYNAAIPMGWWGAAPAFAPPDTILREASADPLAEGAAQCQLLRDIVGNPFRPVSADERWDTSTVRALVADIRSEQAFDHLPVLADALMDAGCDEADILDHCRGGGPHVRGCWVIDLLGEQFDIDDPEDAN